jgi:predicted porin
MQHTTSRPRGPQAHPAEPRKRPARRLLPVALCVAGLGVGTAAQAFEWGPFSLTGFAKASVGYVSNGCEGCQREPEANRHFIWADDIVFGKEYGGLTTDSVQIQPRLGLKFDLPAGFKLSAAYSQRFRDGEADLPGVVYERSATLSHEFYGTVMIGNFPSRAWNRADFPYASDVGQTAFSDSGAAYGILTTAVRYTSRELFVAEGNLVLEATYDQGNTKFKRNKPELFEIWALWGRGPLLVEAVAQASRNGAPAAFAKAGFTGLTPFPERDDQQLGGSSQGIFMMLAKYQIGTAYELSGGLRYNRWSGAYAVQLTQGPLAQWNTPFNVDWNGFDANGVPNPGYSASSVDFMLGLRKYINPKAVAYAGLTYLGEARTDNPSERGQSNSATFVSLGGSYDVGQGLSVSASINAVSYRRKGLAPLSMPAHDAFSNVDSRVANRGSWVSLEANYRF